MWRAALLFPAVLACAATAEDYENIAIERVSANLLFAEGPVWSPEGFLLFCDVPANKIFKINTQGQAVFRENSGGASGLAYDGQGRLYVAEGRAKRVTRTDKKGKTETLAESFDGKKLNAPNDLAVSKAGHVYFSDPAFGKQAKEHDLPYSVYHITPKGEIALVAKWETRPNGVALSPDARNLYVTNSDERTVYAFDIAKDGRAANQRLLIKGIDGPPDGIKVDEKGNLFIAANGIAIYSPEGKHIHTIPITEKPSNLTFGEADAQSLYVTARMMLYRVRLNGRGAVSN